MKKEFLILIPIYFNNAKAIADKFMEKRGNNLIDIVKEITDELTNDPEEECNEVLVFTAKGFAIACNNKELKNLYDYFITRINIVAE